MNINSANVVSAVKISGNENKSSYIRSTYSVISNYMWSETKRNDEGILFSSFQEINFETDGKDEAERKMCLLIGYPDGYSIWDLSQIDLYKHSAIEILSKKMNGSVYLMKAISNRVLEKESFHERPLIALAIESNPKEHHVAFYSLKSNTIVKKFSFKEMISDIQCNNKIIAIGLKVSCKIKIIDIATMTEYPGVINCWKSNDGKSIPVFALGEQYLAYQPQTVEKRRLVPIQKDTNINDIDSNVSDDEWESRTNSNSVWNSDVKNLANHAFKNFVYTGTKLVDYIGKSYNEGEYSFPTKYENEPGFVEFLSFDNKKKYVIGNFKALTKVIVKMKFDPSGYLLVTIPDGGQEAKIWPIIMNDNQEPLYNLFLGVTTRTILDINFDHSSTLISFVTNKGSTHIYPILPYGGETSIYTHMSLSEISKSFNFGDKVTTYSPERIIRLSSKGSLISYLYNYPVRRDTEESKLESKLNDHCCLVFGVDGSLVRHDLKFQLSDLKFNIIDKPHFKWHLCRTPNKEVIYSPLKLKDKSFKKIKINIFSGLETKTHSERKNTSNIKLIPCNNLPKLRSMKFPAPIRRVNKLREDDEPRNEENNDLAYAENNNHVENNVQIGNNDLFELNPENVDINQNVVYDNVLIGLEDNNHDKNENLDDGVNIENDVINEDFIHFDGPNQDDENRNDIHEDINQEEGINVIPEYNHILIENERLNINQDKQNDSAEVLQDEEFILVDNGNIEHVDDLLEVDEIVRDVHGNEPIDQENKYNGLLEDHEYPMDYDENKDDEDNDVVFQNDHDENQNDVDNDTCFQKNQAKDDINLQSDEENDHKGIEINDDLSSNGGEIEDIIIQENEHGIDFDANIIGVDEKKENENNIGEFLKFEDNHSNTDDKNDIEEDQEHLDDNLDDNIDFEEDQKHIQDDNQEDDNDSVESEESILEDNIVDDNNVDENQEPIVDNVLEENLDDNDVNEDQEPIAHDDLDYDDNDEDQQSDLEDNLEQDYDDNDINIVEQLFIDDNQEEINLPQNIAEENQIEEDIPEIRDEMDDEIEEENEEDNESGSYDDEEHIVQYAERDEVNQNEEYENDERSEDNESQGGFSVDESKSESDGISIEINETEFLDAERPAPVEYEEFEEYDGYEESYGSEEEEEEYESDQQNIPDQQKNVNPINKNLENGGDVSDEDFESLSSESDVEEDIE